MINTDLVKQGVAVKCSTIQEVKELFNAMEWKPRFYTSSPPYGWRGRSNYYWVFGLQWNASEDPSPDRCKVDFSELNKSRLAQTLGVNDGEKFKFGSYSETFWIEDGILKSDVWSEVSENRVCLMINSPDKIELLKKYIPDTLEDAKAAMRLGFNFVERVASGHLYLTKPGGNTLVPPDVSDEIFKDVKKYECVKLSDILDSE